jgi:glucokinase
MRFAIGVDLGGTQLRAACVDEGGHIHTQRRVATSSAGPEAVIEQIIQVIDAVADSVCRDAICGIGVASPGPVDLRTGVARRAHTIAGWTDVPLRDILTERTAMHVIVQNDANAAALGEWHFGSGRGCDHLVYVTIGTGIGGGVITDRKLVLGRHGMATEIGHMTIQSDGALCGCGNHGCWEALASGSALAEVASKALAAGQPSMITQIAAGAPVSATHVARAAESADALALDLMRREGEWIGIGLTNLVHLFAPDRIALGGGVSRSMALLEPHIRREMAWRVMPPLRDTPVNVAQLGDDMGVLGAATLIFEQPALPMT